MEKRMTVLVVTLSSLLALIFLLSAAGKLVAPDRGQRTFAALRIPVRRPRYAALGIIAVEALVAVGLIVASGWPLAFIAWSATALTLALLAVVVRAHRSGSAEECGCFGDWLPSRIGAPLIARNVAITVTAIALSTLSTVAALAGARVGILPVLFEADIASPIHWSLAACVFTAAVVATVIRAWNVPGNALTRVNREVSDEPSGAVLLPDRGEIVDLTRPGTRPRLLVFLRAGCRPCIAARQLVSANIRTIAPIVDVYFIYTASSGNLEDLPDAGEASGVRVGVDVAGSLGHHLDIGARRPAAALVTRDGERTVPVASEFDNIRMLIGGLVTVAVEGQVDPVS